MALLERPAAEPAYELYRAAYYKLSRSREWSESGPQAIALSEILAYCQAVGITETGLVDNMVDLVQAMDGVFIEHMLAERKAKSSGSEVGVQ